jgi:hypothetical protein
MSSTDTELVEGTVEIDGRELELSNLDKVLYPDGSTKKDVLEYYRTIAPVLTSCAAEGATRVGLPKTPEPLASYVSADELLSLTAACLRAARSPKVVEDVRG